jgi:hypothetical protein
MLLKEFMQTLHAQGVDFREYQLRYAIKQGRVSEPKLNPSLKYVFGKKHIEQCRKLFGAKKEKASTSA